MPDYSYVCNKCGSLFEFKAKPEEFETGLVVICPKCESKETTRASKGFDKTFGRSGTYRYSDAMDRMVKISGAIPGLGKCPTCSTGTCGL
ncbi:MAG: zinc ribbon domain-containing protein [Elusimicrobiota bacterium]